MATPIDYLEEEWFGMPNPKPDWRLERMEAEVEMSDREVLDLRHMAPDEGSEEEPGIDCVMCATFIGWLYEAWPADAPEPRPDFRPRERGQHVRIHSQQADYMPFCPMCSGIFVQALSQYRREELERKGQAGDLAVRPEGGIQVRKPGLILPGQPGFRAP